MVFQAAKNNALQIKGGQFVQLDDVTDTANRWLADLFVSIHVNAGGGRGAETFCYYPHGAGGRLAGCIQNKLVMGMQALDSGYLDRGVKVAPASASCVRPVCPPCSLNWDLSTARMCGC